MRKMGIVCLFLLGAGKFNCPYAQPVPQGNPIMPIPASLQHYAFNKTIPVEMELPILTALSHYPELDQMHIVFKIVKAYPPFNTRPDFASLFRRKDHRTYIIRISNKTIDTLMRLLYMHLSLEQQVGVIGHELGHVVDFNRKNFFQSFHSALGHLSQKYLDRMEFNTDRICIEHGLGDQLLSLRKYVFATMQVKQYWRGVDHVKKPDTKYERYMNPETIEKYMKEYGK